MNNNRVRWLLVFTGIDSATQKRHARALAMGDLLAKIKREKNSRFFARVDAH